MIEWFQIDYIKYLKDTYGKDLKQAMYAGLSVHCNSVAQQTMMFGLQPQATPDYYKAFQEAGGDSDYLQFAVQCFLEVRQDILRASQTNV